MTEKPREKEDVERLDDRFKFHEEVANLPNRSFWLLLRGITDPQGRAKTYVDLLNKLTPEKREKILKEEGDVMAVEKILKDSRFNIFSKPFQMEVGRLMAPQYPTR
jgi:hypothetical protein